MMTTTMYLADSSAWIDYLRNTASPLSHYLEREDVGHTEPVALELLSGARDAQQLHRLERMLAGTPFLPFDSAADFPAATEARRRALRQGLRVGVVDCLILAVAGRCSATLITRDRPQGTLAEALGVGTVLLRT